MALLSRLFGMIAPEVCHGCDGGSGSVKEHGSGRIRVCPVCGGTGQPSLSVEECEGILNDSRPEAEATVTIPRSVA
jgi:hypothetical protein